MTWLELVRHYFPSVSDDEANMILWEYTGFPGFWNLTSEYPTPLARCRKQLRQLKYRIRGRSREANYGNQTADAGTDGRHQAYTG